MTRVLLVLFLALRLSFTLAAQAPAKATDLAKSTAPANDIFSGAVTAAGPDSVTVVRKVPARPDEYRTFVVDKDTKIEGKLTVKARVTVRFKSGGDGTVHALRVVVRAQVKTNSGPGRSPTAP